MDSRRTPHGELGGWRDSAALRDTARQTVEQATGMREGTDADGAACAARTAALGQARAAGTAAGTGAAERDLALATAAPDGGDFGRLGAKLAQDAAREARRAAFKWLDHWWETSYREALRWVDERWEIAYRDAFELAYAARAAGPGRRRGAPPAAPGVRGVGDAARDAIADAMVIHAHCPMRLLLRMALTEDGYAVAEAPTYFDVLRRLRVAAHPTLVVVGNRAADYHAEAGFFRRVAADLTLSGRHRFVLLTTIPEWLPPELVAILRPLGVPVVRAPFYMDELLATVDLVSGRAGARDASAC